MKHTHKPKTSIKRCFTGPVESDKPNPRAHGWATIKETCRCGAVRLVNVNKGQKEVGHWQTES